MGLMRKYGKKKTKTLVEGHQNCAICHADYEKESHGRARQQNKDVIDEELKEIEDEKEKY